MAYTEIHPIKSTLDKALDYICNPEKTDEKILISSFGCSHETADMEFQFTLDQTKMKKGDNLAHHLIQSFEPGETTPEQAHEIGKKLADIVTGGQYEYVLSTHIDKGHIHNHIMFCAANFIDHKKYNSNKRSLYGIQNASDRLCREYGLSTIIPGKEKGKGFIEYTDADTGQRVTRPAKNNAKSWTEHNAEKQGTSWKAQLKKAIDDYIAVSSDFEDMLKRMEADGFTIKRASYHSYKLPGADAKTRFTGGPSLGPDYTDERIRERIAGLLKAPKRKTQRQQPEDGRINLLIDIQNNIKAQQSVGYARSLAVINLKEAAKTLNYLTENNILEYAQLQGKIAEVAAANQQTVDTLKQVEKRIADMGLLIKNIEVYQRTKPVYDQYRQAKNKDRFRQEHESEIILYEASRNTLKAIQGDGGKLPNPNTLRAEYDKLTQEKDRLYQEYGKLKKQVKQLDTLKTNVDKILNVSGPGREPEQDKRPTVDL